MSIIEQRLTEYKAYQAFVATCRDRIRYDHLWLYEIIADKTLVLTRLGHWKKPPHEREVTESVVLVTHNADGTDTVKTPTRELKVTPQYRVRPPDTITYGETVDG